MIGKIVYILGIVAAIWCVLDIFKRTNVDLIKKILISVVVLVLGWVGILLYYFLIKDRL